MKVTDTASTVIYPNIKVTDALDQIDFTLIARSKKEEVHDLLNGSGGTSMYFLNRYLQTGHTKYETESIEILEQIIDDANKRTLSSPLYLGTPIVSSSWLIDYYIQRGVLDADEKCHSQSIIESVIQSVTNQELRANQHDLFYGFIGKALLVMEHKPALARPFITLILDTLKANAIRTKHGIYWKTPYPFYRSEGYDETINFGIPHGGCGIILFLLKCCDVFQLHDELRFLLEGSIDYLINRLNQEDNKLLYSYPGTFGGTGKLGWCYGDQAIAYTLLRYHETLHCERAKAKACELIAQASTKSIEKTGVNYYPEYGYYDLRVCHGTSSVAYMWHKMYMVTRDENIKILADKWLDITLNNLDIFLPQLEYIAEREKDNNAIDTSMGFLNGLSGVGLVLISFLNPKLTHWDKLLLLDRPERE